MSSKYDAELSRLTYEDLKRAREAKLEDIYKRYDRIRTEEKELHWALNSYSRTRQTEENKLYKDNRKFEEIYQSDISRLRGLQRDIKETKKELQNLEEDTEEEELGDDVKSTKETPEKTKERLAAELKVDIPPKEPGEVKEIKNGKEIDPEPAKDNNETKIDARSSQEFNSSKERRQRKESLERLSDFTKKDKKRRRTAEESSDDERPLSKTKA